MERPHIASWHAALLVVACLSQNTGLTACGEEPPEMMTVRRTPEGVRFGLIGKTGKDPQPTLFVLALGIEEMQDHPAYCEVGHLLARRGWLSVVVDAPCHGEDMRPGEPEKLDGWRQRLDRDENFIAAFNARASSVLDLLVQEGATDAHRVAVCGTSRGGFLAFHFAAAEPRVRAAAGLSPVTRLLELSEFSTIDPPRKAAALDLLQLAPRLVNRAVWVSIGNRDERVGTDAAIAFTRAVVQATPVSDKPDALAPVELLVAPAAGHSGVERAHQRLAEWLANQLPAQEQPVTQTTANASTSGHGGNAAPDPHDWPTYNYDARGWRFNAAEQRLGRESVTGLVEKWRFPTRDSKEQIGVVHATVVVGGSVYFGTETRPAIYRLAPDGKLKWVYRNPDPPSKRPGFQAAFGLPQAGFMSAALVTTDMVYAGDIGGTIYALDRETGVERWKIDTRSEPFPGAHASNCIFAAPILAERQIIVAGGGFEHGVGADPRHRCCTGRGFVVSLEPDSGKVLWKYDVGPEPQELDPPLKIRDAFGEHVFHFGPSTSSVWCTPSYDASTQTLFFGTDCHNSPRQPTDTDPRNYTEHSCAVIALDATNGSEKWVTQISAGDIWNYSLPAYDPETGRYKDQSIGDTPKIFSLEVEEGRTTQVVGCGSKNGGFYVLDASNGKVLYQTPIYTGPPIRPPTDVDPRTLALPSAIGGLQTGCAADGRAIYTNGIDMLGLGTGARNVQPTGGRVVSLGLDTQQENWRHERPKVAAIGGTRDKPAFTNVGDPVAAGIAIANGVAYFTTTVSSRLVALDTSTGQVLKEIPFEEPVWSGPTVSRGRVYVGAGNLLFSPGDPKEAYFPKSATGAVYCLGLPEDQ